MVFVLGVVPLFRVPGWASPCSAIPLPGSHVTGFGGKHVFLVALHFISPCILSYELWSLQT